MRYLALLMIGFAVGVGCSSDETTSPPALGALEIDCADQSGQDYQVVSKIRATVTDAERNLVIDSLVGSVNGVVIKFSDGDSIDDEFEWTQPSSWDPPMVCRGDMRVTVHASDSTGLKISESRTISK